MFSLKGLKELKVFVDLASISAGEGDLEVARVKLLHAATTGYAPLIFNLDDQCDYNKFLEQCKLVWKELKADAHLPLKLVTIYFIYYALIVIVLKDYDVAFLYHC